MICCFGFEYYLDIICRIEFCDVTLIIKNTKIIFKLSFDVMWARENDDILLRRWNRLSTERSWILGTFNAYTLKSMVLKTYPLGFFSKKNSEGLKLNPIISILLLIRSAMWIKIVWIKKSISCLRNFHSIALDHICKSNGTM